MEGTNAVGRVGSVVSISKLASTATQLDSLSARFAGNLIDWQLSEDDLAEGTGYTFQPR